MAVVSAFTAMPAATYLAQRSSCLREPERWLVFENQMSTEVTIVIWDVNENGEQVLRATLGTISAGQTEKLTLVKTTPENSAPDRALKLAVASCALRAKDPLREAWYGKGRGLNTSSMIWQSTGRQSSSDHDRIRRKAVGRSLTASLRSIEPSCRDL